MYRWCASVMLQELMNQDSPDDTMDRVALAGHRAVKSCVEWHPRFLRSRYYRFSSGVARALEAADVKMFDQLAKTFDKERRQDSWDQVVIPQIRNGIRHIILGKLRKEKTSQDVKNNRRIRNTIAKNSIIKGKWKKDVKQRDDGNSEPIKLADVQTEWS